jgi:hypothetical protein
VHIYDVKESGRYTDGFKSGNISFKVRKNENEKYDKNMEELSTKINKMGMSLKKTCLTTSKPQ